MIPVLVFTVLLAAILFLRLFVAKTARSDTPERAKIKNEQSLISEPGPEDKNLNQNHSRLSGPDGKEAESFRKSDGMTDGHPADGQQKEAGFNAQIRNQLLQARSYFRHRQYQKAFELFESIEGSAENYWVEMGQCHYFLEDFKNARLYFQRALLSQPDDFAAKKFMAFTCYHLDQLETSLQFAREALVISPDKELQAFISRLGREVDLMKGYADKQTPNFKIIFSRSEHGDIKHTVIDMLNNAYRTIGKRLGHFPEKTISVVLYNERLFFDITRAPAWAGGLFDGKIRIPIKGIRGREELLKRVLFHEYTHALVHDLTPSCPLWINEGLAEYFSARYPKAIGQVIPLTQLAKDFPFRDSRMVALAYLESYSAVSFLISKFGMYRIRELLEALGKGSDFPEAFETVFLIRYEKFLKTWGKP